VKGKKIIMQLALLTLVGMPVIAIIIDRFSETVDLRQTLLGGAPFWQQVAIGIALGGVSGIIAQKIIELPFMNKVNSQYASLLGHFNLNWNEIIFIAMCAGVGEELLFRGALQPLMGIILTALVFVAIHGYLNPRNWRVSVYGIAMTGVIIAIGYSALYFGLISAMIAHMVIDIYLLHKLQKSAKDLNVPRSELLNELEKMDQEET